MSEAKQAEEKVENLYQQCQRLAKEKKQADELTLEKRFEDIKNDIYTTITNAVKTGCTPVLIEMRDYRMRRLVKNHLACQGFVVSDNVMGNGVLVDLSSLYDTPK